MSHHTYRINQSLASNGTCITFTNEVTGSDLDCAGYEITGSGTGYGILINRSTDVMVRGCNMKNFTEGVHLESAQHARIEACMLGQNSECGIYDSNGRDNTFYGNRMDGSFPYEISHIANFKYGIFLNHTNQGEIRQNEIIQGTYGIWAGMASGISISENNIHGNSQAGVYAYMSNNRYSRNTFDQSGMWDMQAYQYDSSQRTDNRCLTPNKACTGFSGTCNATACNRAYP